MKKYRQFPKRAPQSLEKHSLPKEPCINFISHEFSICFSQKKTFSLKCTQIVTGVHKMDVLLLILSLLSPHTLNLLLSLYLSRFNSMAPAPATDFFKFSFLCIQKFIFFSLMRSCV